MTKIAPSVLAADLLKIEQEVSNVDKAGAEYIHIDVMDGHFVPNITMGPSVVKAIRDSSPLPFDVHLMIAPADPYIVAFAEAGADIITVHQEAGPHLSRTLQLIKSLGKKAGVSLNPATPVETVLEVLNEVDLVLVMSVNPGFSGQAFISKTLKKISIIRQAIDDIGRDIDLEIDGGINKTTSKAAIQAGADVIVAGSATFAGGRRQYAANIRGLRNDKRG